MLGRDRSYFVKHHSDSTKKLSETDIFNMLEVLIDNIFVMFGGRVFNRQSKYKGLTVKVVVILVFICLLTIILIFLRHIHRVHVYFYSWFITSTILQLI